MKIQKIDVRLMKNKQMDRVEKRRLQNRKSALKCRLRKSHIIATLTEEVKTMKVERQNLYAEVSNQF
jgi:bZIP transcription factor